MLLSEIKKIGNLKVIRNGAFDTLGFMSNPQEGMLTFFEDASYGETFLKMKQVSCVITKKELIGRVRGVKGVAIAKNPRLAFYAVHNDLARAGFYWKDFPTVIAKTAKIHPRAVIAPRNVKIGENSIIEANAVILERCLIGKNVQIMAGAVLGSIGLQVTRFGEKVVDMLHAGGIRVCDNVQVMPNAVIAAAVFGQFTNIGKDSRIGNLAFISHNVQMARRCFVGHGAVINGNVTIGKDTWIGPGAVISNNISIGSKAFICLGSTIIDNVPAARRVKGCICRKN